MNFSKTKSCNKDFSPIGKRNKWKKLWINIKRSKAIYLMLLPVMAFYIIFSYVPLPGIVLAWKDDYLPKLGLFGGEWVGWQWFEEFFNKPKFVRALWNTLKISGLKILFCFPAPIILALLLNEVKKHLYRKTLQWMVYLPYFISWVIIGGIVKQMLQQDTGMFNNIREALGLERRPFLIESQSFYTILILTELWKGVGWGTVIYIASISGISPTLYEAAEIDGCKRFGQVWFITLPCLLPIITVQFIMSLGNIMNAGFDPIYNLYNDAVLDVAEIIDTLVYERTLAQDYGISTAVGLFKNVINFGLLMIGNVLTKKVSGYSMYSLD